MSADFIISDKEPERELLKITKSHTPFQGVAWCARQDSNLRPFGLENYDKAVYTNAET